MSRFYVTGSAGFIGSNLVKRLKKDGNKVYGHDNYSTGSEGVDWASKEIPKDLDAVFHLGMPSSSPLYKEDPEGMCSDMVKASISALEWARVSDCPIIYASSSSLYNGHEPPHVEAMRCKQQDYYTVMRQWLEDMSRMYWNVHGVKSIGLRVFSCYGPGDVRKGKIANVVTQFAVDMMNGKRPLIYGDGEQNRDFIHVDDVVEAFVQAYNSVDEGVNIGVLNVGTGVTTSFNEVISIINDTLKTYIKPKFTENQIHNYVFTTQADVSKMNYILGFKGIPFKEAFPEYINKLKGEI